MGEINFLSNNNKDGAGKDRDKKNKKNIEWSEPNKNNKAKGDESPKKLFRWFSFLKKRKAVKKDKEKTADLNRSRKKILDKMKENSIIEKQKVKTEESANIILEKKANSNKQAKDSKTNKNAKKKIKQKQEEQEWENPDILETNLIKDEIVSFFDWQKGIISLAIAFVLPCFIVAVIYGFLFSWEKKMNYKNQNIVDKINEKTAQIEELETIVKDVLFFQKKLKLAAQILDSHIYWTNFFKFLENYTLADVFYNGFAGDISGNYSLTAKAKNFWTIAQQIKTMRANDNVLIVNVNSGQSSSGSEGELGVDFELELSVKPSIFIE